MLARSFIRCARAARVISTNQIRMSRPMSSTAQLFQTVQNQIAEENEENFDDANLENPGFDVKVDGTSVTYALENVSMAVDDVSDVIQIDEDEEEDEEGNPIEADVGFKVNATVKNGEETLKIEAVAFRNSGFVFEKVWPASVGDAYKGPHFKDLDEAFQSNIADHLWNEGFSDDSARFIAEQSFLVEQDLYKKYLDAFATYSK